MSARKVKNLREEEVRETRGLRACMRRDGEQTGTKGTELS